VTSLDDIGVGRGTPGTSRTSADDVVSMYTWSRRGSSHPKISRAFIHKVRFELMLFMAKCLKRPVGAVRGSRSPTVIYGVCGIRTNPVVLRGGSRNREGYIATECPYTCTILFKSAFKCL